MFEYRKYFGIHAQQTFIFQYLFTGIEVASINKMFHIALINVCPYNDSVT